MTRCLFDTNVIISAVLFNRSVPEKALIWALQNDTILMSIALSEELADVLGRPRFDSYISYQGREEFLMALLDASELVEVVDQMQVCRDPEDDKILELAVSGKTDYILTGDDDLLVLNPFQRVSIITPTDFLLVSAA